MASKPTKTPASESLHRLDSRNIKDPLLRSELYKEVRNNQTNPEWKAYMILPSDVLLPEWIAYKVYGVDLEALKWIVAVAAGLDDFRGELEPGTEIRLPTAVWIRNKIKEYQLIEGRWV